MYDVESSELAHATRTDSSAKHVNMLVVCQARNWPLDTYLQLEHPLQTRIREIVATLAELMPEDIPATVDGCSLPTYVVSLRSLARLFVCLARPQSAPQVENTDLTTA
jgi:L-asparaginase II